MPIIVNPRFDIACISFAKRAKGRVYNHPSFKDGEEIVTSEIVEQGPVFLKTENTQYLMIFIKSH